MHIFMAGNLKLQFIFQIFTILDTRGSPLNNDTRVRNIEAYNRGNSCQKIEEIFDHNKTTVANAVKCYLLRGEIENMPRVTITHTKS
ncbi:hypothetical protein HZS_2483 [Henneguya salminicola]|nr:hypothetical protein HZS_2483 [Henneguya salminicola]